MELIESKDSQHFKRLAAPILQEGEDRYNLFAGVLKGICEGRYERPYMAAMVEKEEVLALFQMTPPHPMNVIIADDGREGDIIREAISSLVTREVKVPSLIGLRETAEKFAECWTETLGLSSEVLMDQGIYRLDRVVPDLSYSEGDFRVASEADSGLILEWYQQFEQDTHLPKTDAEAARAKVDQFIAGREVFLWEAEGKTVAMLKKSRPTDRGITVSLVFTPREERKKGYARSLVARVSHELLKEYEFCTLYTDMTNPTSNKIYQEIGYRNIADSVHIGFV